MGDLKKKFLEEPSISMFDPLEQGVILTLYEKKHVMNAFQVEKEIKTTYKPVKKKRGQINYATVGFQLLSRIALTITYYKIKNVLSRLADEKIVEERPGPNVSEKGYYLNPDFETVLNTYLTSTGFGNYLRSFRSK